jgi:long-chain acyl-CoA synthetase
VVALIVPDWQALAANMGLDGEPATLGADSRVHSHFAAVVDSVNQGLASFESVKYFALLPRDFSEAQDELTPSLKKKRRVIARHFEKVVEDLYSAHKKRDVPG